VLGLGDQVSESAPQAQFTFDYDGGEHINVTHDGGDAIDASSLNVTSSASIQVSDTGDGSYATAGESVALATTDADDFDSSDTINAGTVIYIKKSSGDFSGETIRIVWQSPNSDKTATIGQFET
jgi:hypothetical protein